MSSHAHDGGKPQPLRSTAPLGIAVGAAVAFGVMFLLTAPYARPLGDPVFWGLVLGIPLGVTAMAAPAARLRPGAPGRRRALWLIAVALPLFVAGAAWWNLMRRDGLWLLPFALLAVVGTFLAVGAAISDASADRTRGIQP